MPNPKTIKDLLKMDAYPFRDKQIVLADDWNLAVDNKRLGLIKEHNKDRYVGFEFVMPTNGYYLPPYKQLGLPLRKWTFEQLYPLVKVLPYGVIIQYFHNKDVAIFGSWRAWHPSDLIEGNAIIEIKEQPPNLYNPLDHKEEVLMENSSANEKQPAKETEKMALPWQNISTLEDYEGDGDIQVYAPVYGGECYPTKDAAQQASKKLKFTHWFPITPPKATTVEAPVEPERVSVQEFAKDPASKWVNTSDGCPIKGWYQIQKEGETVMGLPFKLWDIAKKDHPIYATDPTAYLAYKAEQEGNQ